MYKTSQVFNQILTEKLLIEVAFFGPNLPRVVDYLESSSQPLDRSYLVLHYAPSVLTMKHSLVPLSCSPRAGIPCYREIIRISTAFTQLIDWLRLSGILFRMRLRDSSDSFNTLALALMSILSYWKHLTRRL